MAKHLPNTDTPIADQRARVMKSVQIAKKKVRGPESPTSSGPNRSVFRPRKMAALPAVRPGGFSSTRKMASVSLSSIERASEKRTEDATLSSRPSYPSSHLDTSYCGWLRNPLRHHRSKTLEWSDSQRKYQQTLWFQPWFLRWCERISAIHSSICGRRPGRSIPSSTDPLSGAMFVGRSVIERVASSCISSRGNSPPPHKKNNNAGVLLVSPKNKHPKKDPAKTNTPNLSEPLLTGDSIWLRREGGSSWQPSWCPMSIGFKLFSWTFRRRQKHPRRMRDSTCPCLCDLLLF